MPNQVGGRPKRWQTSASQPRVQPLRSNAQFHDLTSACALVVDVSLERHLVALCRGETDSAVGAPEIECGIVADLFAFLPGRLHLLGELGSDPRGQLGARLDADEAPALPPIPHRHLAAEGLGANRNAILERILRQRVPSWQRHVVNLVLVARRLENAELHGQVLHPKRLPPARVHLFSLDPQLRRHRRINVVTLIHRNIAETKPRVEELEVPRIPQVLPANKFFLLRVLVVLNGNVHPADQSDVLGPQRHDGPVPSVAVLVDAELHLEALHEQWVAVVALDAPPMHEQLVLRHNTLLRQTDEPEAFPLLIKLYSACVASGFVDLEAALHGRGRLFSLRLERLLEDQRESGFLVVTLLVSPLLVTALLVSPLLLAALVLAPLVLELPLELVHEGVL
mmetsp:Transcript_68432/g.190886  ORF Transcript_68432/g.190886 Transcript_68432/m.190886 type:complete len:396 (+) Transcript_68432:79-1266(+)